MTRESEWDQNRSGPINYLRLDRSAITLRPVDVAPTGRKTIAQHLRAEFQYRRR